MKNFLVYLLTVLLLVFMLAGCAAPQSNIEPEETVTPIPTWPPLYQPGHSDGPADSGSIKIGLCILDGGEENDAKRAAGFRATCDLSGTAYEVLDAAGSTPNQIANLRSMKSDEFDVIVVGPGEETKLVGVCQEILNAGIDLITITEIPGVKSNIIIDPQDYMFSYKIAFTMAQLERGVCQAAILYDSSENWITQQRVDGFRFFVGFNKNDYVVDLVREIPVGSASEATAAVLELWEEYPDAQIWCTNADALIGASQAAQERDRESIVGGAELNADTLELLAQGKIQAVVAQFPYAQGRAASEAATSIALGQAYPSVVNATYRTYNYKDYERAAMDFGNHTTIE